MDKFDWKIIQALQKNGRLTNQEIGDLIGLSASQCSRRRQLLEQKGIILGYSACIHPEA
ncbi:Lrp/AsnC family transcriptional regulator, partial [Acinetobacter variabilis]